VWACFGIRIPDKTVVPGHSNPWQAFRDAYFAESRIAVWHASRGFGGKSYLLALLGLVEALTLKASVKILGGSFQQSQNVQNYISKDFYNHDRAPKQLWDGDPLTTISRFVWGNSIESLTASQNSIRGPHCPRLRLDECDEMKLDIFDGALGQPMSVVEDRQIIIPAQTVASSTHHHADGTFTEILKRAKLKEWPIYKWGWQETSAEGGWLLPSEVEAKRGEVTAAMFDVEYNLTEPSPEGRAILPEAIEAMFKPELGEFHGRLGEYIEIEAPVHGARYATGADWAKMQDFTVIITMRVDVTPYRVVAFERRGREPWPQMVARFDKRMQRYPRRGAHDETGVGGVVSDYMTSNAQGVKMVGKDRTNLLMHYCALIEDYGIEAPMIEWMYNEHKYAAMDDLYGSGHCPDSIVAGAMANRAASARRGGRGT